MSVIYPKSTVGVERAYNLFGLKRMSYAGRLGDMATVYIYLFSES